MSEENSHDSSQPRRTLRGLALPVWMRATLAAALTACIVWYLEPAKIFSRMQDADATCVALAAGLLVIQYALAALRWHYILRRHAIQLPGMRIQAIFGAGAVANLAALTAIAGMSVRGMLLARSGVAISRILGVLFVERVSATMGFGICFLTGFAAALPLLRSEMETLRLPAYAGLLLATAMAALALLVLVLLQLRFVRELLTELRHSFLSTGAIVVLALLSCVIVWLGFAAVAILARGMQLDVSPAFFLVVMPVVAFLAALPVSLGGWGVREGAMVAGLLLFGVAADAGAALSITYGALGIAVTLVLGGSSALLPRSRNGGGDNAASSRNDREAP